MLGLFHARKGGRLYKLEQKTKVGLVSEHLIRLSLVYYNLEQTRLETWFGEIGLKIRPDVFRHDNCEQILTKLTYSFVFSQNRND